MDCGETFTTREVRDEDYKLLLQKPQADKNEKNFIKIVKGYVLTLSAKEQAEFFDKII